ncbi:glycoside hydrolase family 3 protein [Arthrobacter sp. Leaf69]|uniref:glycoside hydrolase family 3 protein n=1 Tax=Arthrobacter sp. Leaf69 TaxID=1736232 RepID=UPI000AA6B209
MLGLFPGIASCSGPPTPDPSRGSSAPAQTGSARQPSDPPAPSTPGTGTPAASSSAAARPLGWGPQQRDADAAAKAVAAMSPEERAGQVLMPFYTGLNHNAHAAVIERLHLAGSIIMGDNVPGTPDGKVDTAAMHSVTGRLQAAARAGGRSWPGLIGVDQEGGVVARLRAPLTEWPAPMSYGAAGSGPLAADAGRAMASELAALGFNTNFAPTTDVTMGPADPTIGARSMSGNAKQASGFGVAFSQGMLASGLLPAAKHFPGHGSVSVDSHAGLPVQGASLAQLRAKDLLPFQAAIDAGLPMVMVGHIAVPALEPGVPASVSKPAYAELRRMGFDGVAVTDALNMGAIRKQFPHDSAAPLALAAGADLLLMPSNVESAHAAIMRALNSGTLPPERLAEAAQRVVTMMIWRGRAGAKPGTDPGSGAEMSHKVSQAAITVLSGPCDGRIVPASVRVTGGSAQDRSRFAASARNAGIGIGEGPLVSLIGSGGAPAKPGTADVAVALDAPWLLAGSRAPAKIAVYGRSQGAFDALAAVLAGHAKAPGKLPVAVGSQPPGTGCG